MPRLVGALVAVLLLSGCIDVEGAQQTQPASAVDGFRATGRLDGARVAISRGAPIVVDGDCDPNQGFDDDLCILTRTIDGVQLNLVVENPAVLRAGSTLEVAERPTCREDGCDDVTDVVVIDVRVGGEPVPVESGRLEVSQVDDRVAAEFDLFLGGTDRLIGEFDVARPRAAVVIGPDGEVTESATPGP